MISEWIWFLEFVQAAVQGSEQSNLSTQSAWRSYCDIYKNQLSSNGHLVINT